MADWKQLHRAKGAKTLSNTTTQQKWRLISRKTARVLMRSHAAATKLTDFFNEIGRFLPVGVGRKRLKADLPWLARDRLNLTEAV